MTGSLTVIGNATVLLRHSGFTVPNFLHRGERAYLGKGLWSRRRTEPALKVHELPPIDAVVLSHLHGDHFDRRARRGLPTRTPIVTTRAAARTLRLPGVPERRRPPDLAEPHPQEGRRAPGCRRACPSA